MAGKKTTIDIDYEKFNYVRSLYPNMKQMSKAIGISQTNASITAKRMSASYKVIEKIYNIHNIDISVKNVISDKNPNALAKGLASLCQDTDITFTMRCSMHLVYITAECGEYKYFIVQNGRCVKNNDPELTGAFNTFRTSESYTIDEFQRDPLACYVKLANVITKAKENLS